jgi:hypothetical protein
MALPEIEQRIEVHEGVPGTRPAPAPVPPPPALHASALPPDLSRALSVKPESPSQFSVPVLAPVAVPAPPPAAPRAEAPALPIIIDSRALPPTRLDAPPSPPAPRITRLAERLEKETRRIESHSHERVRVVEKRDPPLAVDRAPALGATPAPLPQELRAASPVTHTTLMDRPPERPDIHVSIGRVIVNAPAAQAAPKPAPPPAAPVRLTLDQYLRQRGESS